MLLGTGTHRLKASLINNQKKKLRLKGTRKQKQRGDEREGGDEHTGKEAEKEAERRTLHRFSGCLDRCSIPV